jgi:peptidoglycan hydrolase CwlO-like protein
MERMMDNETFDEVLNGFKEADSIVKRLKTRIVELEEENKKLKEELGEYKKMFEDQLKEAYIKNTAEFLDKKFPKVN